VSRVVVLEKDRGAHHRTVVRHHAGVVGHQEGTAAGGDVLDAHGPHAPPVAVDPGGDRDQRLRPLPVEAELVDRHPPVAGSLGERGMAGEETCERSGGGGEVDGTRAGDTAKPVRRESGQAGQVTEQRAEALDVDRCGASGLEVGVDAAALELAVDGGEQPVDGQAQRVVVAAGTSPRRGGTAHGDAILRSCPALAQRRAGGREARSCALVRYASTVARIRSGSPARESTK
jgi:hypothetical protein